MEIGEYKYINLDKYCDLDKLDIQNIIKDKLKCSTKKAKKLYYKWKKIYMGSKECIPSEDINVKENKYKIVINNNIAYGKYGTYKLYEGCIKADYLYFNNEYEVEKYRYFRYINNLKECNDKLDEIIEILKRCP